MKTFWSYFRDTLAWFLIRKPGPLSVLVKGLGSALDQARLDMLYVRDQFLPERADPALIAAYGLSRGVAQHRLEGDELFRQRVIFAYAWQLLGGRILGMPRILKHYGYDLKEIFNMRLEDEELWAEFRAIMTPPEDRGFRAEDFELILWALNDMKPARSKLAGVRYNRDHNAGLSVACTVVDGDTSRIYPRCEIKAPAQTVFSGAHVVLADKMRIYPHEPQIIFNDSALSTGAALRMATITRIGVANG